MVAAAHDDDRLALLAVARSGGDEPRHDGFARLVALAAGLVGAQDVEVPDETLGEVFDGLRLLEEVIPERVGVLEAQPVGDVAEPVGVFHSFGSEPIFDAE